jgi:hypothetical protein
MLMGFLPTPSLASAVPNGIQDFLTIDFETGREKSTQ